MTAKKQKQPTNAELMALLRPLVQDVADLKQWKHDQELTKVAVAEYVKSQPAPSKQSSQSLNKELLRIIMTTLGIIAALVTIISQFHGAGK